MVTPFLQDSDQQGGWLLKIRKENIGSYKTDMQWKVNSSQWEWQSHRQCATRSLPSICLHCDNVALWLGLQWLWKSLESQTGTCRRNGETSQNTAQQIPLEFPVPGLVLGHKTVILMAVFCGFLCCHNKDPGSGIS